ncbi:fatty-acyl-CoA synthase [Nocardioides sp. J9]|uniref:fatty-acid--CoA ligase FadD8 n=1 Tax=unclassified Nocardioides TaxID=2615069 RepID=UPI000491305A|nr:MULTISPECIES: fatty-acid--CoA ligase FadD8 [unclassified Nocardioides]TWG99259.1 fatty-acyl-CoA synthase [Nocardioides sp. J9]
MTDTLRTPAHNGHLMVAALKRHADRPIVHLGDVTLTGRETAERISQYIQAFESLGAGRGTPGALLALNRPEVLFILGAGQTQGFQRTSLHPLGSADDHAYVINDAGITTLVIDPYFAGRAVELLGKCPGLKRVLTIGPVPEELADVATDLTEVAASFEPRPLEAAVLEPDHITSITYTGGTTGKPKGVIGNVRSFSTMAQIQMAEWEWPTEPRFLMCTPLSHAGAAFFVPVVLQGGTLFVSARFDPAEVLRTIEEKRINSLMLVPTMLYALMDHPDSHTRDLSSLETVYYGASAINPVRLKEAIERFGPIFAQYYGQSEAPMVISYFPKGEHVDAEGRPIEERLTSCGRPSAYLRTALLGEDGNPVPQGEPGEICVAGPLLSAGYWQLPEATAETFRDGWMHTGDVAREDEDGFWYIVDRTKDMIVTGGFNVFPREVEDVIAEHPAIAQVGVIGTPHEKFGEAVTAVVVLREGHELTEEVVAEIQAAVKERKGSVQAPKEVIAVDALPLTALGKPDKKALRARFWTGERSVG